MGNNLARHIRELGWPVYGLARRPEVFAGAKRDGFSWSIHRPNTIVGYALGNAMNMGTTLAA